MPLYEVYQPDCLNANDVLRDLPSGSTRGNMSSE